MIARLKIFMHTPRFPDKLVLQKHFSDVNHRVLKASHKMFLGRLQNFTVFSALWAKKKLKNTFFPYIPKYPFLELQQICLLIWQAPALHLAGLQTTFLANHLKEWNEYCDEMHVEKTWKLPQDNKDSLWFLYYLMKLANFYYLLFLIFSEYVAS